MGYMEWMTVLTEKYGWKGIVIGLAIPVLIFLVVGYVLTNVDYSGLLDKVDEVVERLVTSG